MELMELIRGRRTVHRYKNQLVEPLLVQEALETALWAPNHKNTEPWRFLSVGPSTKQKLLELNLSLNPEMGEEKRKAMTAQFSGENGLIVLGCVPGANPKESRENYASVACGVQNISLFLWGKGLGCKWGTGKITEHEKTYEILSWSPSEIEIVGFLWFGYPAIVPPAPKRVSLDNVLKSLA